MTVAAQIMVRQRSNFPPPLTGREPEIERVVWLYKDVEGEPETVSKLFDKAFLAAIAPIVKSYLGSGKPVIEDHSLSAGQADYSASFLCGVNPGQIVPRHDQELYPVTEYLYIIDVSAELDLNNTLVPCWHVTLYRCNAMYHSQPTMENMSELSCRSRLTDFVNKYKY